MGSHPVKVFASGGAARRLAPRFTATSTIVQPLPAVSEGQLSKCFRDDSGDQGAHQLQEHGEKGKHPYGQENIALVKSIRGLGRGGLATGHGDDLV
jgi:hypothetical protein